VVNDFPSVYERTIQDDDDMIPNEMKVSNKWGWYDGLWKLSRGVQRDLDYEVKRPFKNTLTAFSYMKDNPNGLT
jgi:hypothetical protein